MKKGVTVIICTHNGRLKLGPTLLHLANQSISSGFSYEIIVVDNASIDRTSEFVTTEWEKYKQKNIPLTVIDEHTPGKLFALQKGISNAKYEYFVLCDDDNWLNPDYLDIAFNIMESDPGIGAAGGRAIAVSEKDISFPSWFETYQNGYAAGAQAAETGDVTSRGHLWGAGLISRTALYKETYKSFPSLLLTEQNRKILSTEDTEYCLRIILMGYRLYYSSSLVLKHFISPERLTIEYKNSLYENFRQSHLILEKYYLAIKLDRKNLTFINRIRLALVTPLRLLFTKNKDKHKTIMHYLFPDFAPPDPLTSQIKKFISQHGNEHLRV